MAILTLRASKGAPLSVSEVDGNFTNLNNALGAAGSNTIPTPTGTGVPVLSTSPTLVTPILGTPTSGNFSTGTFTWPTFNQNTSGTAAGLSATLGVASGGTGLSSVGTSGNILTSNGTAWISSAPSVASGFDIAPGTSGNVLTSNGTAWVSSTPAVSLPSQTGNNGKYLKTDGTTASWTDTLTAVKLSAYREVVVTVGTVSTSTYSINLSLGNIFDITLGTNVTFTFTNPPATGFLANCTIILRQNATGSKTATFTG